MNFSIVFNKKQYKERKTGSSWFHGSRERLGHSWGRLGAILGASWAVLAVKYAPEGEGTAGWIPRWRFWVGPY